MKEFYCLSRVKTALYQEQKRYLSQVCTFTCIYLHVYFCICFVLQYFNPCFMNFIFLSLKLIIILHKITIPKNKGKRFKPPISCEFFLVFPLKNKQYSLAKNVVVHTIYVAYILRHCNENRTLFLFYSVHFGVLFWNNNYSECISVET